MSHRDTTGEILATTWEGLPTTSGGKTTVIAIAALALSLRWYYLATAVVIGPVRGDATQYFSYAWNLAHHGVFSKAIPGSELLVGDSFRDPGYPLLLAGLQLLCSTFGGWYAAVLGLQGLLGALTAPMAACLVKDGYGQKAGATAGILVAIWPQSVTITSFLLSETLLSFLVMLATLLLWQGLASLRESRFALAGLVFSMAGLTNAVLLPFAALLALVLLRCGVARKLCLILAAGSLALPLAWGIRNIGLPPGDSSGGRALVNAVQGSWPEYHWSYLTSEMGDPEGLRVKQAIEHEFDVLSSNPAEGAALVAKRLRADPAKYLIWYLHKPALLWDWGIRVGSGDIYVYPTGNSPFLSNPVLRALCAICKSSNLLIMWLALAGTMVALWRRPPPGPVLAMALLIAYVTAVYSLLQAEPRYSIPFRGMELALAVAAMACSIKFLRSVGAGHGGSPSRQERQQP